MDKELLVQVYGAVVSSRIHAKKLGTLAGQTREWSIAKKSFGRLLTYSGEGGGGGGGGGRTI